MNTPVKIGGFGLGVAVVFAAALGLGAAFGPTPATAASSTSSGPSSTADPMTDMGGDAAAVAMASALPGGLTMSEDGYTLDLAERSIPAGPQERLDFRILGADGAPVTGYDVSHEKQLHLIVVRRDLTGFQHVHPTMAADGTWSVPLDLSAAGEYRVLADFVPTGHGGVTLGADLSVAGDYQPQPWPVPSATAEVDGYTVTLEGRLVPGQSAALTLSVSKDGMPVTDLQPYLAAYGHLVALRDGDLAYLHVHPAGEPGDGVTPAGPGITFYATAPTAGDYRLFLNFQHDGVVRTAEFTAHADQTLAAPVAAGSDGGH